MTDLNGTTKPLADNPLTSAHEAATGGVVR
ncbi:hypothetical protein DFJ69_5784 [Thermomonospora umbrina]|uniref:Uncharacterized protein n=1 Tax=Thermomonospora umbrina TaxID=111806 RepID=A0A3D9T4T4_9ACTN|nr:hypothetical protein DFJ69_5784 [Thermomonospora umbrina]